MQKFFGEGDYRITVNNLVDGKLQCTLDLNNSLGSGPNILISKTLFTYDFSKEEITVIKEIMEEQRIYDYIYLDGNLYYSTVLYQKGESSLFYYDGEELKEKKFDRIINFQYDLGDIILIRFSGDSFNMLFDKETEELKETKNGATYYCASYVSENAIVAYTKGQHEATLLWNENGELKYMKIEKPKDGIPDFYYIGENTILMNIGNEYYYD